jgi:ADP-ribose pyrophosphatase YjhB (NUDIX family)
MADAKWLGWSRRLAAIAQTGLEYASDVYDRERYDQIRRIAAEIAAAHTDASAETIADLFARDEGYATPKIDVRGVVLREGRVLLVRERSDGGWTLPGGWADVGDTPTEAVTREVREETGFTVRVVRLLALYDRDAPRHGHPPYAYHAYKAFFLCEMTGGEAALSVETDGVDFFAPDALPRLSTLRVTEPQLTRIIALANRPGAPTDLD